MKNNGSIYYDAGILSIPLSFRRDGRYFWQEANTINLSEAGFYWSLRSDDIRTSNCIFFSNTFLVPQHRDYHGAGFAVRCTSKDSVLIET